MVNEPNLKAGAQSMLKVLQVLSRGLSFIVILLMTVLVLTVSWQVLSRYLLNAPSSITEELSRFLLMWLGLLGGAYTFTQQKHLSIDLLKLKVNPAQKSLLMDITYICTGVFALVLIYGGAGLMKSALLLGQTTPTLGIPMGYVYLAVPVAGAIIFLYSWYFFLEHKKNQVLNAGEE